MHWFVQCSPRKKFQRNLVNSLSFFLLISKHSSGKKLINIVKVRFVYLLFHILIKLNWDNRYRRASRGTITYISLDGTDFRIMEPSEFSPKWYSTKFHGPDLRYELGLCIRTREIVWVGYTLRMIGLIFFSLEMQLYMSLTRWKKISADRGYRDQTFFDIPNGSEDEEQKKKILAWH